MKLFFGGKCFFIVREQGANGTVNYWLGHQCSELDGHRRRIDKALYDAIRKFIKENERR